MKNLERSFLCETLKRELQERSKEELIERTQDLLGMYLAERERSRSYRDSSSFWWLMTCGWSIVSLLFSLLILKSC